MSADKPPPLHMLHGAYYAIPAGEPSAEMVLARLPDLYAAIEAVLADSGRIGGLLATVDDAERLGVTVHVATRSTCVEHLEHADDKATEPLALATEQARLSGESE